MEKYPQERQMRKDKKRRQGTAILAKRPTTSAQHRGTQETRKKGGRMPLNNRRKDLKTVTAWKNP